MENSLRLKFGSILSQSPSNEEVVISGNLRAFPSADTIEDFKKNLQNKINMVTRKATEYSVIGVGLFKNKVKFDSGYFGMLLSQFQSLYPIGKLLLEKCYECIFDAGLHSSDLEGGTRTGIILGF
ncbi:hypothetical protein ABEB36_007201 [Hypothenemus hampei]|uniref:Beta-ketoacyl synthase-like N-terminal domain-containing protein n=1 Tax=Hypothenemus hampei TaxID=57062 RepID=A0ABD1ET98_HYPHA